MNILKKLSLEQIKALDHEQIYELSNMQQLKSKERTEEIISISNDFFNNCVYLYNWNTYYATKLNWFSKLDMPYIKNAATNCNEEEELKLNLEHLSKLHPLASNESISVTMKKIIKICDDVDQKLYIIFMPVKHHYHRNYDFNLLNIKNNQYTLKCDHMCQNKYPSNKPMPGNNFCPGKACIVSNCHGHPHVISKQSTCTINLGRKTDLGRTGYNNYGYKIYAGNNFQVYTKDQLTEKLNISNIDEFIINPKTQNIESVNSENHVIDWLNDNYELVKYVLPWKIQNKTFAEKDKTWDFSECFNFVDMIKLKKYLQNSK